MVHSHGAKITHHCCGSSRMLIPRFIECGMDALQTIQAQAEGMNPYELKPSLRAVSRCTARWTFKVGYSEPRHRKSAKRCII